MLESCHAEGGGAKSAWVVWIGLGCSALPHISASGCVRSDVYGSGQASAAVRRKQSHFLTPCGVLRTSGIAQVLAEGGASRRKQFFSRLQPYVLLRKLVCSLFTTLLSFMTVPF